MAGTHLSGAVAPIPRLRAGLTLLRHWGLLQRSQSDRSGADIDAGRLDARHFQL